MMSEGMGALCSLNLPLLRLALKLKLFPILVWGIQRGLPQVTTLKVQRPLS